MAKNAIQAAEARAAKNFAKAGGAKGLAAKAKAAVAQAKAGGGAKGGAGGKALHRGSTKAGSNTGAFAKHNKNVGGWGAASGMAARGGGGGG